MVKIIPMLYRKDKIPPLTNAPIIVSPLEKWGSGGTLPLQTFANVFLVEPHQH